MDLEQKIKTIASFGEEIIDQKSLQSLLEKKQTPIVYDGFEPSGRMHIAQSIIRVLNANKLIKAGCKVKFVLADWFAFMNLKLGGDIDKIRNAGKLFIENWKACGLDMSNVEFVWTSEMIKDPKYWELVMNIATKFTVPRITKCTQIMGRGDKETLMASQIFYPVMQTADIFYLGADICNLGLDQRKVNMLAIEYCQKTGNNNPPVIISNHMLMGLKGKKMSKSDPESAIFLDDTKEQVIQKIMKSYCPPKIIEANPLLEYIKYIIFPYFDNFYKYKNYNDFEDDFKLDKFDIKTLKENVANEINKILEPIRKYFEENEEAKKLSNLVKTYTITK